MTFANVNIHAFLLNDIYLLKAFIATFMCGVPNTRVLFLPFLLHYIPFPVDYTQETMVLCVCVCGRWWVLYDRHSTSAAIVAVKSLQSCTTLCDPTDGSPPGSPVPGILQARTLEWVAITFSDS